MAKYKRLSQEQLEHLPWLHIYSQWSWHGSARVIGTVDGLKSLRDAIDKALQTGQAEASAIASDGEGYSVEIVKSNIIDGLGSPFYLQDIAK